MVSKLRIIFKRARTSYHPQPSERGDSPAEDLLLRVRDASHGRIAAWDQALPPCLPARLRRPQLLASDVTDVTDVILSKSAAGIDFSEDKNAVLPGHRCAGCLEHTVPVSSKTISYSIWTSFDAKQWTRRIGN